MRCVLMRQNECKAVRVRVYTPRRRFVKNSRSAVTHSGPKAIVCGGPEATQSGPKAMPISAEDQFRARAWRALEAGKPFSARGETNKALLEEVRLKRRCLLLSQSGPKATEGPHGQRCPDCSKEVPLFMIQENDSCNECFEAWLIAHPPPRPKRQRKERATQWQRRSSDETLQSASATVAARTEDLGSAAAQGWHRVFRAQLPAAVRPNPLLLADARLRCEDCFNTLKQCETHCIFCGKTRAELRESKAPDGF